MVGLPRELGIVSLKDSFQSSESVLNKLVTGQRLETRGREERMV